MAISLPTSRIPRKSDLKWCGLLMFSLCYELPLIVITPYDRFNPRLFDVVVLIAFFATKWRRPRNNKIIRAWEVITLIFVICAIISYIFLLPAPYGYYSLFFAAQYIEGLLALWILMGFNWEERHIHYILKYFCVGMIVAGVYGVLQFIGVLSIDRFLPNGEKIAAKSGIVLATLGATYFHAGVMGALGSAVSLALYMRKAITIKLFLPTFMLSLFLAVFAGSRAGLAMAFFLICIMVLQKIKYLVIALIIGLALIFSPIMDFISRESVTVQRIDAEDGRNSVDDRISANHFQILGKTLEYHGPSLFLFGGGFYAVPLPARDGSGIRYRIGYGFHNIHFFVLEQGGIFAFFAAIYFWFIVIRSGYRKRNNPLARCGMGIAIGIVVIGWMGQIFYFGFGTEHLVIAEIALMSYLVVYSERILNKRSFVVDKTSRC